MIDPNVPDREFERQGRRDLREEVSPWFVETDWDAPTPKDIVELREELRSRDLDEIRDRLDDGRALDEFMDSDETSPEWIAENLGVISETGKMLAAEPFLGRNILSVDVGYRVRAWLTAGGPNRYIDFNVDDEGNLMSARAHLNWGGKSASLELTDDEADRAWQSFAGALDDIRMRDRTAARPGMRQR